MTMMKEVEEGRSSSSNKDDDATINDDDNDDETEGRSCVSRRLDQVSCLHSL